MSKYFKKISAWKENKYNVKPLEKLIEKYESAKTPVNFKSLIITGILIVSLVFVIVLFLRFQTEKPYTVEKNNYEKMSLDSTMTGSVDTTITSTKKEIVNTQPQPVKVETVKVVVKEPAKKETVKVVVKEPVKMEPVKQEEKKTVNYNEPKSSPFTFIRVNDKGYYEYKNEKDGSVLIYIPAGEFTMGSESGESDEKPVHKVYLDGYYIMKYEVTNKQYKKFCDATGRSYPSDPEFNGMSNYFTSYPDYPMVVVSYNDAKAYVNWAGLRLPTEAEWEKAARGTDSRTYPWGNGEPGTNRCNYNNSDADGYRYTSPIGSYENGRSPYGCYDMSGNVWEWCNDWYGEKYYRDSEYRNPKGPSSGDYRVLRGGSWSYGAFYVRSALRADGTPSHLRYSGGFRCSALE